VGLARVLAKEPKMAEQWLKEGKWFPDKRVRQWLADVRQDPPEQLENWKNFYSEASAWAHPTAESCMAQLKVETDAFVLSPLVKFSSGECRGTVSLLSSTAVFACFAFRNAVVDERAIDPNWRRDLYDLAREVSDDPMSHLDRDWQAEKEHFDAVMTKLRDRRHLKRELKMNPRAWDNLKPGG
jgi:hypothetical protein